LKKLTKILAVGMVLLFTSAAVFAFDWISLSNPKTNTMAQVSAGYGSWLVIPLDVMPVGAIVETKLPFMENLSAGAGFGYLGLIWDEETNPATLHFLSLSAYAKYIALTKDQMEKIIHMPLYIGAAAGLGYQLALGNYTDFSGDAQVLAAYGGLGGLAVGLVGYEFGWATLTFYGGLIDRSFSFSGDFQFRLSDTMHLGIFWVPLLGLGATFTVAF